MPDEARRLLADVHEDASDVIEGIARLRRLVVILIVAVLVAALFIGRIVEYAVCASNRQAALTGPGNDRITLFFQAYAEAAGANVPHLTDGQRQTLIAGLDAARKVYTVLPPHPKLEAAPAAQLLAYRDLIASLRANAEYNAASAAHPVCSFWSFP